MKPVDPERVGAWWSVHPMDYSDARHGSGEIGGRAYAPGTREFFEAIDAEFVSWSRSLTRDVPFDRIFPYDSLRGRKVLEIGCGLGRMAMLWAASGAAVTAIDLSANAVAMTRRRFGIFGLDGDIRRCDARDLPFADAGFDYVYSWGVLHHSPDLGRSLAEMMRVLRPGGEFLLMLYNRASAYYRYKVLLREGFLHYESRFNEPLALISRYTDADEQEGNPHTWPVTEGELRALLDPMAEGLRFRLAGEELGGYVREILPLLGKYVPVWALKPWARRWGWSHIVTGLRRR